MSKTALLVDGSALFLKTRVVTNRPLKYEALNRHLLEMSNVDRFSPAIFFTTVDPQNEGQQKFLRLIKDDIGWEIKERLIWEYDKSEFIRFSAMVAFCLGRLSSMGVKHAVVVSDDYTLEPILQAARSYGVRTTISFVGRVMDPRWIGKLNIFDDEHSENRIEFFDLEEIWDELLNQPKFFHDKKGDALSNLG